MERFFSLQRAMSRGIIPLLLLFLLIPQASGIGVGASPDRIDFGVVNPKEGAVRELYVINTGDEPELVMLTVERVDLTVDSLEFDLDAQESRAVTVSVDQKEAGKYDGSILITARPSGDAASGLGLGAGVRVPVTFVVKEDIYGNVMIVVGLLAVIAVALLLWMRRSKR